MKTLNKALLITTLLYLPLFAFALPDDFRKEVSIEADKVFLDEKNGTAVYEGNVTIKQGSIYISAARLTIKKSDKNSKQNIIHAKGNSKQQAIFQQTIDLEGNLISGTGDDIIYRLATSTLHIRGNGKITRGKDVFIADTIKYLMEDNILEANQESSSEDRVSITLHPEQTSPEGQ
ncbi:lipopolysaccharide transport periplasmic protein LptA [Marinomonas agarivorans]|nr:lipopolysaccharide transport periplasmic protein LptA [Marinomonas agarivorans]